MIEFTVFGPPVGYYAQGRSRPKKGSKTWLRMIKYHDYQRTVRQVAAMAGIKLPVKATSDHPLKFTTISYFSSKVHPDPENVHKGIKDALFWEPKDDMSKFVRKMNGETKGTADKYTAGYYDAPLYDKENPRVEVIIEKISPGVSLVRPGEHSKVMTP